MKTAKFVFFFVSVLLAGILAGCINPIAPISEVKEQAQQAQTPQEEGPAFTVTLAVGENGEARSVFGGITGSLAAANKYSINIGQLVVVNTSTGEIIYDSAKTRTADSDPGMTFSVVDIPFGEEYIFMLLMGHKERANYTSTTNYQYTNKAPTLLLTGTMTKQINGPSELEIGMWPLVVDTKFVANQGVQDKELTVEPAKAGDTPSVVLIPPTATTVIWKLLRSASVNGFTDLFAANKLFPDSSGKFTMVTAGRTIVRGVGINSGNAQTKTMSIDSLVAETAELTAVGTISLDISLYTRGDNGNIRPIDRIGKEGSVNFELDYVPFGPDLWNKEINNENDSSIPVWIIRNGINSEPQDAKTVFVSNNVDTGWGIDGANGNGAIRFKPTNGTGGGEPVIPGLDSLAISSGTYKGTNGAELGKAKIDFTTEGSDGADVYYVSAASKPEDSSYQFLGTYDIGTHVDVQIAKPADGHDIYMLIYKEGKIAYFNIKTSGGTTVEGKFNEGTW
jgi:hypothetical protein